MRLRLRFSGTPPWFPFKVPSNRLVTWNAIRFDLFFSQNFFDFSQYHLEMECLFFWSKNCENGVKQNDCDRKMFLYVNPHCTNIYQFTYWTKKPGKVIFNIKQIWCILFFFVNVITDCKSTCSPMLSLT